MPDHPIPTQDQINEFVGAAHGDFVKVRQLLQAYPALVNANAYWQETAIQAAAQMGQVEIAEKLLSFGADPNAGADGTTPLHGVVMFSQAGMVSWLLAHGAQANVKNYENKTPLELAQASDNTEIAAILHQALGKE